MYSLCTNIWISISSRNEATFGSPMLVLTDIGLKTLFKSFFSDKSRYCLWLIDSPSTGVIQKVTPIPSWLTANSIFRQRVSGASLDPPVKTLGISVHGGVDMDGNLYPDVAVGAYENDTAFLFKLVCLHFCVCTFFWQYASSFLGDLWHEKCFICSLKSTLSIVSDPKAKPWSTCF